MKNSEITKNRLALLLILSVTIANLYWLYVAFIGNFRNLDVLRLVIGGSLEGFGIWALIRKVTNSNLGIQIPTLLIVGIVIFGVTLIWYGLLHGGEARVSPSIWK
jgi:hypothetical protein